MVTITPNLAAFATDNLLVKERVYNRLLKHNEAPNVAKARMFFLAEFNRAMQHIRAVVVQESLT